jgi:hypothetical protein
MRPGPNLKLGTLLFLVFFVASASVLYAGAGLVDRPEPVTVDAGEDGAGCTPAGPTAVTLIAQNIKFDKRSIVACAGQPVTVTVDNRDAGTLHNVAFYTNRSAAQIIHKGEIFPGPAIKEERFTAPGTPGSYFFRCDVHPDTMTGTFSVR